MKEETIRLRSKEKFQLCPDVGRASTVINWTCTDIVIGPLDRPASNELEIDGLLQSIIYADSYPLLFILQNGVIGTAIISRPIAIAVTDEFSAHIDFKIRIRQITETRSRKYASKV